MGCDVIDRIVERGFKQGFEEGRKQGRAEIILLMKNLFAQKRFEDAQKATEDTEYCMQLLKEFGIIKASCTRRPSSSCPKTSAYPSPLAPCKPDQPAHGECHA